MSVMYKQESDALKNTISSLVSGNNAWEFTLKFFSNDKIGKKYFEDAKQEVLDVNSISYSAIVIIALENMSERIQDAIDYENHNTDIDALHSKIYKLESENRKLTNKIKEIEEILK